MRYRSSIYKLVVVLFSVWMSACNCVQRLYTVFPDAKRKIATMPAEENVIRIYFDRVGYIYPDDSAGVIITDQEMRINDSRLPRYYMNNPANYLKICDYYNATHSAVGDTAKTFNIALQTALINKYIEQINEASVNKTLVFLIHGFNSAPLTTKAKGSADEFKLTREAICHRYGGRSFLFVEVYWDGLDDTNGWQNFLSIRLNDLKIWPHAQASATYAGLELRRILAGLTSQHIHVLTHSHGAGVITTALFNTHKFDKRKDDFYGSLYKDKSSWLYNIQQEYQHKEYNTPLQQYTIGMLAPAIPGVAVFQDYYHRTINGVDSITKLNNYHFIIGFNHFDPVTRKFNLLAKKYGSTTLACLQPELDATKGMFANNPAIVKSVDFSYYKNGSKQQTHDWMVYVAHVSQINDFLDLLTK